MAEFSLTVTPVSSLAGTTLTGSGLSVGTLTGTVVSLGVLSSGGGVVGTGSGTVTSVGTGGGLTGGPVTSSGTISHADTSTQANITATANTYVDGLTFDTYGHVTGVTTVAGFDGNYSSLAGRPATFTPSSHTLSSHSDVSTASPTDGQVLAWNNTGSTWEPQTVSGGGTGLTSISQDTTPQLGGDLDLNNFDITGAGDIGIDGGATFSPSTGSATLTLKGSGTTAGDETVITENNGTLTVQGDAFTTLRTNTFQLLSSGGAVGLYASPASHVFRWRNNDIWHDGNANAKIDSHLNQANPTSGYVLSWDGTGYAWVAQSDGGRNIPQNTATGTVTLDITHAGDHISISSPTGTGVTVPANIFSVGDVVTVYNNSTSNLTITQGTNVTLRQAGTANTGPRTLAQYGVCSIMCVEDVNNADVFVIAGAGLS